MKVKVKNHDRTTVIVIDGRGDSNDNRTPPDSRADSRRIRALTVAVIAPKPGFDGDGLIDDLRRNFGPVDIRIVVARLPENHGPITQSWFDSTADRLETRLFAAPHDLLGTYLLGFLPERMTVLRLDEDGNLYGDSIADSVAGPWDTAVGAKRRDQLIKRIHRSIDELVSKDPELHEAEN